MNYLKKQQAWTEKHGVYYYVFRNIAIIASHFSVIVIFLLITSYVSIITHDPVHGDQIQTLIKQSQENPGDAGLIALIGGLDQVVRKAYFSHLAFTRFGSYLLLGGIIVLLLSLKIMTIYKQPLPAADTSPVKGEHKKSGFIALVAAGLVLVVCSFIIPYIFKDAMTLSHLDAAQKGSVMDKGSLPDKDVLMQHWIGFRGYGGLGVSPHTDLPTHWDGASGENIRWKTALELNGFNSPIIWNDYLFLSGADEQTNEVYCYDTQTGALIWKKTIETTVSERPETAEDTGYAASTMATNGLYVYVIFATGTLCCLDMQGQIIWQKELGVPENHYGHASSLLTFEDFLYVQFDHGGGGNIIAIDAFTGKVRWRQTREVKISWASPILIEHQDRGQLILTADPLVESFDAYTGKRYWSTDCMSGEVGPSAAYAPFAGNDYGLVFATNEYAQLVCINNDTGELMWDTYDNLPEASSPVAVEDYLIVPTSWGALSCYNPATGEEYWVEEYDEGFYASPVIADSKIYISDREGITYVIALDTAYSLIASPRLGEKTVSTPAFKDGYIFIRGEKHLFCIGSPDD